MATIRRRRSRPSPPKARARQARHTPARTPPQARALLAQLRLKMLLRQAQVAKLIGVSQQTYGKYESGVLIPDRDTKERIAAMFDVPVRRLWPPRGLPRTPSTSSAEARL